MSDIKKQQQTPNTKTNKTKLTSKYLSSLEIKKYLLSKRENDKNQLTIDHLQSFYRFCDEKSQYIYDVSCTSEVFIEDTLHFNLVNVMNDILVLFNFLNTPEERTSLLLQSLEFSFPKGSLDFLDMKNDIRLYGKHLHHTIISYFQ